MRVEAGKLCLGASASSQMQLSGFLMQQQPPSIRPHWFVEPDGKPARRHCYAVPSFRPLGGLHFNSFRQSHYLIQRLPMFLALYTLR